MDASPTTPNESLFGSLFGPGVGLGAGRGGSGGELVGFKRGYPILAYPKDGREVLLENPVAAVFKPHVQALYYEREAEAVCVQHPEHAPPVAECECGFYMLKARPTVEFYSFSGSGVKFGGTSAVLTVSLFGREVIEGAKGFRGAAQQVQAVSLDPRCVECGRQGRLVGRGREAKSPEEVGYYAVEVLCEGCAGQRERLASGRAVFSTAELSGLLGVEVTIAAVTKWLLVPPLSQR